MSEMKLPLDASISETHTLHGRFAISNEHGLVLIGYYSRAGQDEKHAVEFQLAGANQFKIQHLPGKDHTGWPRYFDEALPLGVERISLTMLEPGEFKNGAMVEPGDLFLRDGSAYLIGQPEDPRQGNAIDLNSKAVNHISHGDGYLVKKWRIDAYSAHDERVLTFGRS